MYNIYFTFILITVTVGLISSCSKKDDTKATAAAQTCTSGCTALAGSDTAAGSITVGSETLSGTYTSQCFVGSPVSILVDSGTASPDIKSFGYLLNVRGSDNVTEEFHAFTDATCTAKSYHLNTYYDNVTVGSGAGGTHQVSIKSTSIRFLVNTTAAETWAEALFSLALTVQTEYKMPSTLLYYNMWNVSSTTFYKGNGSTSAYPSAVDTAVSYTKL